jgi:hypothetical protein
MLKYTCLIFGEHERLFAAQAVHSLPVLLHFLRYISILLLKVFKECCHHSQKLCNALNHALENEKKNTF